ncbi:DUF362 domain-containing protein [Fictibacillus sp. WQ 8-8]|uniref:lactate racemase domain-containing protein n=1 Tax=Fictibacillus sp. WQ 8-8 TaxID=2938788 RepID=UPI00210CBF26|nr:lactate racemase domain-containing protein [Fictibacillus sp. WQ 8-8]MCQ6268114.1 DUF362 domain-containing protein [Fictibacillus sp. WQ 8-8]
MNLPKMALVKQQFSSQKIQDVKSHLIQELTDHLPPLAPGSSVAITVGSRGITNRVEMVKTLIEYLQSKKVSPFIIGAMGSHGGGTPEGQMEILHSLGFSEETMGCPVLTSSDVVEVGNTPNGHTLYCDKLAWEADGIIVMNRIKLHTAFRGPNESGLLKMITVGLGKAKGANQLHRQGPEKMSETVQKVGGSFLNTGKIFAGIGIVENSFDETAHIHVIPPDEIIEKERELLNVSKDYFPRLPVDELDVLVVRSMGKAFSGTGMDTNVLGRTKIFGVPEPSTPSIKRIAILDLDDGSHGNATGIGLADFTTEKLYQKIDRKKTYLNCMTSTYVQRAMIPMILSTDQEAITMAVESLASDQPEQLRIAVIENTLHLEKLYLSETLLSEVEHNVSVQSNPESFTFDEQGNLTFFT